MKWFYKRDFLDIIRHQQKNACPTIQGTDTYHRFHRLSSVFLYKITYHNNVRILQVVNYGSKKQSFHDDIWRSAG